MNQKSKKENNQKERQKTGGQGVGLVGGVGGWAEREWDWKSANQKAEDQKVSLPADLCSPCWIHSAQEATICLLQSLL